MYEEGHRGFSLRSIIIKLLLIVIIIFLIIWLFPTKNYVKNLINQKLSTNANQVFNTNIETMKDAAINYYNGDRLPSKKGDSRTLTLKEMTDKKLLVSFTDSNGKRCNVNDSYVKVTKNDDDYSLKVNLVCKDKKAYINSYISGSSCTNEVCSKKKLTEESEEVNEKETSETQETSEKQENKDTKKNEKSNNVATSNEQCEYVKKTNGYYNYSAWSNWSLEPVQSTNTKEVQTKQERVETGTVLIQEGTTKHTQNPKKVTLSKNGRTYIKYVCPSDFDNGGSYDNYVTCVKTMPNYVNKTTYRNATFYRYRTKTYINGKSEYKWGSCNDNNLTKNGYIATGNKK